VAWFKALLGNDHAVTSSEDPSLLTAHSTDWIRRWAPLPGQEGQLLLRPGSEAEVAAVVAYAYEHGLALVPQGGNTGLW
jgi:FAD/FMN-containing dehydrogenase